MGVWGNSPWDNDGAADWFDSLLARTKLAKYVEDSLKLDAGSSHQEIRAAASVVFLLGRDYIWPAPDLDRDLARAADPLEEISRLDEVRESQELVDQIRGEIPELRSRIKTPGASLQPQTPPKKWWGVWN
jgi:hypothetical protein